MQKNFQHRKVRDAEAGRGDTSGIDLCESAVSLHENQPEMDTGSVGRAGLGIVHGIIFISRYFARKIFFVKGSGARQRCEKTEIRGKPRNLRFQIRNCLRGDLGIDVDAHDLRQ